MSNSKENFDKTIGNYKLELDKKEEEINKLKEKNTILNKKLKNFENRKYIIINNSIDNNRSESYFINSNREVSDLSKNIEKRIHIKNIKKECNLNPCFHSSISESINNRKVINRNTSLSTINCNQLDLNSNLNKKNSKKDNSINESISYFLNKIEESLYNNSNNSRNNLLKNIHFSKSMKLNPKVINPVNITNNNYNPPKNNNVLINLNTINLEKLKLQKKLAEYRKIIDKKINTLKRGKYLKSSNVSKNKKSSIKMKKSDSLREIENYKEKSGFIIKKNILEKMNTNYKNIKRDNSCNLERKKKK